MGANMTYQNMIRITTDYLGPAAPRFIDRQIEGHLGKNPQDINKRDVDALVEWLSVSLSHLTDDQSVVKEYADRLHKLSS